MYRPTRAETVIDFAGRTGYVTAAAAAGAPIVPMVSIGGQETQLYLSRGTWLARALGLTKLERRLFRTDILPISFGFPFGLSVLIPVNMPLPAKIVTEVLAPSMCPPPMVNPMTSPRSTPTFAGSCRLRCTVWPGDGGCPCWAEVGRPSHGIHSSPPRPRPLGAIVPVADTIGPRRYGRPACPRPSTPDVTDVVWATIKLS